MALEEYQVSVTLTEINCGECGGTYAINERYRWQQQEVGGFWNCPYCRVSWGYGDSTNDALKRQLAEAEREAGRERKRREWAEREAERERKGREWAEQDARATERRRRGEKAAKTRLKNRIAKGVCPCCNRSFENLQRHMAAKHPNFVAHGDG